MAQQGHVRHALAQDGHRPGIWRNEADEHANEGRLARGVRTEQSIDLALSHLKRHRVERLDVSEVLRDALDVNCPRVAHEGASSGFIARNQLSASRVTACSPSMSRPSSCSAAGLVMMWKRIGPTNDWSARS